MKFAISPSYRANQEIQLKLMERLGYSAAAEMRCGRLSYEAHRKGIDCVQFIDARAGRKAGDPSFACFHVSVLREARTTRDSCACHVAAIHVLEPDYFPAGWQSSFSGRHKSNHRKGEYHGYKSRNCRQMSVSAWKHERFRTLEPRLVA